MTLENIFNYVCNEYRTFDYQKFYDDSAYFSRNDSEYEIAVIRNKKNVELQVLKKFGLGVPVYKSKLEEVSAPFTIDNTIEYIFNRWFTCHMFGEFD